MTTTRILTASLTAVALVAACASSQTEPDAPSNEPSDATPAETSEPAEAPASNGTEAETAGASAVPEAWSADLTTEQKGAYMKAKVVPAMTPVFKGHDAEGYAEFGCKTCHGPDWLTPTDYLPELTFKDGKITAFEEDPEVAKFMAEQVTPAMAQAMGMQPFDPATGEGFGCGGCHSIATE